MQGMARSRLTGFAQVLIGLIAARPMSGYDLKRFFASTPASVYQPSSGALYPALRRLERDGLLQQTPQPAEPGHSRHRQRHVYQVTEQGRAVHRAWISQPVDPATVAQDLGVHLMRFVMMERQVPRADVLTFLSSLQAALSELVASIERYAAGIEPVGQHGPLALEHGTAVYRTSLDWTGKAIATLSAQDGP